MNLRGTGYASYHTEVREFSGRIGDVTHTVEVNVAGLAGFLLAKTAAAYSRLKPKDWYDIAFVLLHNDAGGATAAAALVRKHFADDIDTLRTALEELRANFADPRSQGPQAYIQQMLADHPDLDQQTERWRSLLRQGSVDAVIEGLKELHGSGPYNQKQRYAIQGEINYFTANKQRMDYPLYRSCGLPIGSGVVEAACKNVVAKRMKQSGMTWSLDGAKDMLQLRASVMSRRFWDDFESLLPSSPPQETDQAHLEAA